MGREVPAGYSQQNRQEGAAFLLPRETEKLGPARPALAGLYLGGDVGDRASKAILSNGAVGAVGRAGAGAWCAVTHGRHYGRTGCHLGLLRATPPRSQDLRIDTEGEPLPPGPAPVISTALFLKVLMTVPSLRRRRGLLLRSATFCFSLERTFKLGSEAREKVARAQTRLHGWAHTCSLAPPPSHSCLHGAILWEARLGTAHLFCGGGSHRGYHRAQAKAVCRREASQGGHSGEGNSGPKKHGGLPWGDGGWGWKQI